MIAPLLPLLSCVGLALPLSAAGGVRAVVQAVEVGSPEGYVTDRAGLFSPTQRAALEERAAAYAAGTGHEIAVLTVKTLEGRPIEDFALEAARAWGLGQADEHDGALLLIDHEERKLRIEVGRGLEGRLTDLWSGRIIREVLAPAFQEGDYFGGVDRALETMHAIVGGESAPPHLRQDGGQAQRIGPLIFFGAILVLSLARSRRRGLDGRRIHGRSGPVIFFPGGFGGGGGGGGGGFGGFGGGGGFSGGGASGGW